MGSIYAFEFSHTTLLVLFILPFAYYGYSTKYWYLPERVSFLNFIIVFLASLITVFCSIRLYGAVKALNREEIELAALHVFPPALALLAIWKGRRIPAGRGRAPGQAIAAGDGGGSAFKPVPLNAEVEELSWDELIINESLKKELNNVIDLLKDPEQATNYGIEVPKGILLNGPPGTGKTTIAKVVANTAGLAFFALRSDQIVSKWVGESEKNLTALFEAAKKHCPAVIFIDEIDSLGKARSDKNASHSDNLLNHLLQLIDGVVRVRGLYIIAATNRADLVDDALKRAGRLNRTIEIPLPDFPARIELFKLYLSKLKVGSDINFEILAKVTEGNSAADIKEICNQAGLHAYSRESDTPADKRVYTVTSEDIEVALSEFAVEEGDEDFEEKKTSGAPQPLNDQIEKITWDDLIVDAKLKEELNSVITLLKDSDAARSYGIDVPKGILLNGPPGTGKTTLAKVIANTANLSFFVLQTDEIISKWVGESEKNLTRLFKAAAKHAPSVIFIDEVDSIGKNRAEGNAQHADNLLNHLLQLIDGVIKREGVYIIAATNRADLVDPALKRGGRLNKTIEVPLPDHPARKELFELFLSRLKLADYVDLDQLAGNTEQTSAADIKEICNQAGLNAFKRESARGSNEYLVTSDDIKDALLEFSTQKR